MATHDDPTDRGDAVHDHGQHQAHGSDGPPDTAPVPRHEEHGIIHDPAGEHGAGHDPAEEHGAGHDPAEEHGAGHDPAEEHGAGHDRHEGHRPEMFRDRGWVDSSGSKA